MQVFLTIEQCRFDELCAELIEAYESLSVTRFSLVPSRGNLRGHAMALGTLRPGMRVRDAFAEVMEAMLAAAAPPPFRAPWPRPDARSRGSPTQQRSRRSVT